MVGERSSKVLGSSAETLDAIKAALAGDYEYKAVGYDNLAAYQADLAVQVAVDWAPISVTSGDRAIQTGALVVTYRRPVA